MPKLTHNKLPIRNVPPVVSLTYSNIAGLPDGYPGIAYSYENVWPFDATTPLARADLPAGGGAMPSIACI